MNRSISLLTFRGSISEAIIEAKKKKKLFVVYISGEDEDSKHLEQSTWVDVKVADSMTKYCIFLHLAQGSIDASQFTAIYPQKSVPCITAVGYNGVKLWEHEGYVSAESLASSIEKAWLTLHIQETTATFLTATLASERSEPLTSSSNAVKPEEGSSSNCDPPSSSSEKPVQEFEPKPLLTSEQTGKDSGCDSRNESEEATLQSARPNKLESGQDEQSTSLTKTSSQPLPKNLEKPEVPPGSKDLKISLNNNGSGVASRSMSEIASDIKNIAQSNKEDQVDNSSSANKSNSTYLNIRLLDGTSLQEKFSVTDTLGLVKDYVDRNQSSNIGSYDLAIPYPRKVFSEQDLSKTLSELELFNRQALIIVPHRVPTELRPQTNAATNVDSSDENTGGYFGYVKRILSYMNPFAYLGGSSSEGSNNMWQYRPNATLQNQVSGMERPYNPRAVSTSSRPSGEDAGNSRRPAPSRFGSNIHTLRHDEDDGSSNDRNTFWNGNSTQYGGNDDRK